MRKRRWHSLRRDGPGRMCRRIAEMLKEIGIEVSPYDIICNNSPSDRYMDLCRWCADGTKDGMHVHVCSWDRMCDIIKRKSLAIVDDDRHHFEVCRGAKLSVGEEASKGNSQ